MALTRYSARLNEEFGAQIDALAAQAGVSVADVIRVMLLVAQGVYTGDEIVQLAGAGAGAIEHTTLDVEVYGLQAVGAAPVHVDVDDAAKRLVAQVPLAREVVAKAKRQVPGAVSDLTSAYGFRSVAANLAKLGDNLASIDAVLAELETAARDVEREAL